MITRLLIMALAIPWAKCRQSPAYIWPTRPAAVDADGRSWTSVDCVTSGFPAHRWVGGGESSQACGGALMSASAGAELGAAAAVFVRVLR